MSQQQNGSLRLLLISYFSFIVIGLPAGVFNVAWNYMQGDFNVSYDALGVVFLAGSVGYVLASFLSGTAIGRAGIGPFLLLGSLLLAGGTLGMVLAREWWVLVVMHFVASVGSGTLDSGMNTYIAGHYPASRMNWLHACFGIGTTIGPALVTLLVIRLGLPWQAAYITVIALASSLAAAMLLTLGHWRVTTREIVPAGTRPEPRVNVRQTLALPVVWLSMAVFFIYAGTEVSAGQLTNNLFINGRGIDPETAGFWVSTYWGSFTLGRMLTGVIVDRIGSRAMLRASMVGSVLGALLLWWNPVEVANFIGLVIMGFSMAATFPLLVSETPRRVGQRHAANAIGFQVGMASLGIAGLPWLGAALAERVSLDLVAPFLVLACVLMFAAYELLLLRDGRVKPAVRAAEVEL